MLSSVLPKKKPTAHSKVLSSDSASPAATTLLESRTHELTGRTQRRCARQSQPLLSRLLEPSLVGQVLAGFHSLLIDHFQLVVGEPAHRRDFLALAVSDFLVNDFVGRFGGRKPIRQYLHECG